VTNSVFNNRNELAMAIVQLTEQTALNPALYALLCAEFDTVRVANAGESMIGGAGLTLSGRRGWKVAEGGEYYCVCCPYCNDTRFRLWINHLWGVGHEDVPEDKFWWAACCYNEGCLENRDNVWDLRGRTWSRIGPVSKPAQAARAGQLTMPTSDVALPGECIPVHQLPADHYAVQYLRNRRGLDPELLYENYEAMWCERADPKYTAATGRIIFPIRMRGIRVGWQGRYPSDDVDWKVARLAKYYTMPGMHKSGVLYNFDKAVQMPFCIVVEGVTDAIALGEYGVAILGKTISPHQVDLIVRNWRKVLIMLDPDAAKESAAALARIGERCSASAIALPHGADPAKTAQMDEAYLWDVIYDRARSIGAVA
jgi:hypothetical protein